MGQPTSNAGFQPAAVISVMQEESPDFRVVFARRALALSVFVGAMWVVRLLDTFRQDGSSVAGVGVIPRTTGHLAGILTAPFIHANWSHLLANTLPLLVLGALVLFNGISEFLLVTLVCILSAGAGVWLFGQSANHIGASGVVFGYMGYLLFRPAFDHRLSLMLVTLIVGGIYGTALLWSLVPRAGISWSAHFFGFAGGVLAARIRK
jgi:membrane associated rhomboid family serine protease